MNVHKIVLSILSLICLPLCIEASSPVRKAKNTLKPVPDISIRMDMVHNNPGEPLYESEFNRPEVIKSMGYNSKCYFLFDSPTLAINWDKFDKDILPQGTPEREWVDRKAARLHVLFNECKKNGLDVYAMSDLILLPKRLVSKYHIEKTFGNILLFQICLRTSRKLPLC